MNNDELFEITDDLPEVIKKQLVKNKERKIIELLNIKSPLSYDQIIVGMFRKFNKTVTRHSVRNSCHYLEKDKLIVKVSKGVYRLPSIPERVKNRNIL